MARRSIRLSQSATCLTSLLLLGIIIATSPTALAGDGASLSLISDVSSPDTETTRGEDLYLEVRLNGNPTGKIGHFILDGGRFSASSKTLRTLGFHHFAETGDVIELSSLTGVEIDYNAALQRLDITVRADLIDQEETVLNKRTSTIPKPTATPGLLLNYDLYGMHDDRNSSSFSAHTELRLFNAWGVMSNTTLSRWSDASNPGVSNDTVRLDTSFSRSFVNRAVTLQIGDLISGGLDWTRPTRLGGIQLRRNFGLQPELITFPVPAFYGQASLPSTVDLYIDGLRQYSSDIPAGPFQLNTVPIVNGNGQAQVVVTDAMGRQNTIDFPFYTTNQLLRAGLSDYSLEAGFVREDYGVDSFSYGDDFAVSGTYRHGISNQLTLSGHVEMTSRLAESGVGATFSIAGAGVINASLAASRDRGISGQQAGIGYNWRNQRFNFSLDSVRTFGDYRDIATRHGPPPPSRSDRVLAGLTLGRAGSVGASYVALKYPDEPRSRYTSVYYSKSLSQRASLNLSVNQNLEDHNDRSLFLGFSLAFGNNVSASLSAQHNDKETLASFDINNPIDSDGGFGWRLRAQSGHDQGGGLGEFGFRGRNGEIRAGLQNLNGNTNAYADLNGALVFMNKQFFPARRIDDAFAVVSTDGVANVPILRENQPIGRTNKQGNLLVTQLNAYQRNKLSIDPMQLPADVDISRVDAEVTPSDRAGTLVKFGLRTVQAASLILHDAEGQPLALGSRVSIRNNTAPVAIVGYDGMVYLEGLDSHNELDIETTKGYCVVQFDYRPQGSLVPLIGPLTCHEKKP